MQRKIRLITMILVVFALFSVIFSANDNKVASAEDYSMIVIEASSGRVLQEKNSSLKRAMASTTKIATAITVIENCGNLDKVITVPKEAVGVEGSSIYLCEGERLTVRQLLYGLMLRSGNDCAVALAKSVGGSLENFAVMMNDTAKKAGATSTNFTNPHGLHNDNHFTTAKDLALISAYAMKNPTFREIVATKRQAIPWEGQDYDRILLNKNKILSTVEGGNGIKTGYTKKAGRCLVSSATRNGMTVICVVLGCPQMFEESARLLEKSFSEYELRSVGISQMNLFAKVENGRENFVGLNGDGFTYPIKKDGTEKLSVVVSGVKNMPAPVKKGDENGKFSVYLNNHLIFSQKLYTIYSVEQKSLYDYIKDLISA